VQKFGEQEAPLATPQSTLEGLTLFIFRLEVRHVAQRHISDNLYHRRPSSNSIKIHERGFGTPSGDMGDCWASSNAHAVDDFEGWEVVNDNIIKRGASCQTRTSELAIAPVASTARRDRRLSIRKRDHKSATITPVSP